MVMLYYHDLVKGRVKLRIGYSRTIRYLVKVGSLDLDLQPYQGVDVR